MTFSVAICQIFEPMPHLDILDPSIFPDSLATSIEQAMDLPLSFDRDLTGGSEIEVLNDNVLEFVKCQNLSGTSVEAGLWLLAGKLERSHEISQSLHDPDGSYWHAIMHRYEGDYWNSKYWLSKAGKHPVKKSLSQIIQRSEQKLSPLGALQPSGGQFTEPSTVAQTLVDLIEKQVSGRLHCQQQLQLWVWWEWQILMEHCCKGLGFLKN